MKKYTIILDNANQAQRVLQLMEDHTNLRWNNGKSPIEYNPFTIMLAKSRIISINFFGTNELTTAGMNAGRVERSPSYIKNNPHFHGHKFIMAKDMTKKAWLILFKRQGW